MTGHENVVFSDQEAENLRKYLMAGGFLNINDSYGMDEFIRLEMKNGSQYRPIHIHGRRNINLAQ